MKLSDLHPEWRQRYAKFSPERGGEDPLPEIELWFQCPTCAPGKIVCIKVGTEPADQSQGRWHSDSLPSDRSWFETATIQPSINNAHPDRHGIGNPCAAHFAIVNGQIVHA